jgi:hypothetical protein
MSQKRGKVFTWRVSAIVTLKAKGILLREDRKCELSAKVRLEHGDNFCDRAPMAGPSWRYLAV